LFSALSGDQRYPTACIGYNPRDTRAPTTTGFSFYTRDEGLISYAAATQTYSVFAPNNVFQTFGPADRDTTAPTGTIAFRKPSVNDGGTERFAIIQPNPRAPYDYTRTAEGNFSGSATSGTLARTTSFCILGVPTVPTDIPPLTIVPFVRFEVRGTAIDARRGPAAAYDLSASTATLEVDLTTGQALSSLHLVGTSSDGRRTDFGTYPIEFSLVADTAGMNGSGPPHDSPEVSRFFTAMGAFFGPQGKEFGYVFQLLDQAQINGASDVVLVITGTVVGAR
jgi:hypothetical protein